VKHILVVDDELGSRESVKAVFYKIHEVSAASSAKEALEILSSRPVDVMLLDVVMPEMNGLELLRKAREFYPLLPVIMISATSSESTLAEALKIGARAFLKKPFDVAEMRHLVDEALTLSIAPRASELLQHETLRSFSLFHLVGESPSFVKCLDEVRRAALTNDAVLIYGEVGTGKEILARQIHSWSLRCNEPFFSLDCASIPPAFFPREVFGSVREAAGTETSPALDLVGSGSLYFSSIETLSAEIQESIAAVISSGRFTRTDASVQIPTRARVVASTKCDLDAATNGRVLSEGLAEQTKLHRVRVPSLRERVEDIPLLAYHFLNQLRTSLGAKITDIEPEALELMREYHWPGNVRELRNVIERILVMHTDQVRLKADDLPPELRRSSAPTPDSCYESGFEAAVSTFERGLIVRALKEANGTIVEAARLLQTTPRILKHRVDKLGIKFSAE
jgi:DNA-binding NtrC family response regulator